MHLSPLVDGSIRFAFMVATDLGNNWVIGGGCLLGNKVLGKLFRFVFLVFLADFNPNGLRIRSGSRMGLVFQEGD